MSNFYWATAGAGRYGNHNGDVMIWVDYTHRLKIGFADDVERAMRRHARMDGFQPTMRESISIERAQFVERELRNWLTDIVRADRAGMDWFYLNASTSWCLDHIWLRAEVLAGLRTPSNV